MFFSRKALIDDDEIKRRAASLYELLVPTSTIFERASLGDSIKSEDERYSLACRTHIDAVHESTLPLRNRKVHTSHRRLLARTVDTVTAYTNTLEPYIMMLYLHSGGPSALDQRDMDMFKKLRDLAIYWDQKTHLTAMRLVDEIEASPLNLEVPWELDNIGNEALRGVFGSVIPPGGALY